MTSDRLSPHPVLDATTQLSWSSGAMTPPGLASVCADAGERVRPEVVECGAGYSTIVLARLVRARGGRLVSVEHDAAWAERVRRELAAAELDEVAQIVLAPLVPHPLAWGGLGWYAPSALDELPSRIDLLLVDGPPAYEPAVRFSRYPALPALAARLAPDATVVLDDIDRRGELKILEAWERGSDFSFEVRSAARIAVGRRR